LLSKASLYFFTKKMDLFSCYILFESCFPLGQGPTTHLLGVTLRQKNQQTTRRCHFDPHLENQQVKAWCWRVGPPQFWRTKHSRNPQTHFSRCGFRTFIRGSSFPATRWTVVKIFSSWEGFPFFFCFFFMCFFGLDILFSFLKQRQH